MGVFSEATTQHELAICEGGPAAVAVLGEAGLIRRATRAFVDRFDVHGGSLASCASEAELIVTGQADRVTVRLDDLEAELVAAVDGDGRRSAVLTIPTELTRPDGTGAAPASPLFDEPLDESPAIVWLKDLDGRYLRVNSRYVEQLGTDAERVCGRTDAELTAAESIEGLRLQERDSDWQEPLELEYYVGAFEERPAFAVLRFALRDRDGQPTATCSVAAPDREAALARSECERLMRIDRWGRLDALAIRQELLDEWGLALADGSSGPPLDRDDRVAAALAERDEALADVGRLEDELAGERERQARLQAESELAVRRTDELDGAVADARSRAEELERSLGSAEERVTGLEAELVSARAELEEHLLSSERVAGALVERDEALGAVERLEHELADEREQRARVDAETELAAHHTEDLDGLRWGTRAQRALSAALLGQTEWRLMLQHAVDALGCEGGWDVAIAWSPDGPRGPMRCGAMWARDAGSLGRFETRTWQHSRDASTAEFGRARTRIAPTCLLELESAEDPLLRAAAAEGMGTALLVPISDGGETIAMVELLARTAAAPDAELMVSLESVALQLGAIAKLIKLADAPRWRMGRV